ncbi:hypothetical protein SMC26_08570 [Actinomadura fulvescens]|uniref:Secreted protein n=1 Tax=Actinomadura fulvescens TaxID=46160 RepID=A0ABP6DA82_9ACTN
MKTRQTTLPDANPKATVMRKTLAAAVIATAAAGVMASSPAAHAAAGTAASTQSATQTVSATPGDQVSAPAKKRYRVTIRQARSEGVVGLTRGGVVITGITTDHSCRDGASYTKVTAGRKVVRLGYACGSRTGFQRKLPVRALKIQVCTVRPGKCSAPVSIRFR